MIDRELNRIYSAANHAVKIGIKVSADHGLTYKNIMPILYIRALQERSLPSRRGSLHCCGNNNKEEAP